MEEDVPKKESFLKRNLAKMKAKQVALKAKCQAGAAKVKEKAVSAKNKATILVGKPSAACKAAMSEIKSTVINMKPVPKKEILCLSYGPRDLAVRGYIKFSLWSLVGFHYLTDAEYVIYEVGKPLEVGDKIGVIKIRRSATKMVIG